jgi:hypothetical protein
MLPVKAHYEQWERTAGKPHPELEHEPELWPENQAAWNAWLFLCRFRPSGWGVNPIPLAEYETFFRMRGVPVQLRFQLAHLISLVDEVFMETTTRSRSKQ